MAQGSTGARNFFEALKPSKSMAEALADARPAPAPDDWRLVVTDVEGSTAAIEAGRHKTVNFVGAAAIAALKNLCAPESIPYQFGGDGATLMVPPEHAEAARVALARTRGFAKREYNLGLRVAEAPVAALRARGRDVLVARYEPLPGNDFAIFAGGGVDLLEKAMKRRGAPDLVAASDIPPELDDGEPPDLTGLSCRWSPLQSRRGKMVALIVCGDIDHGALYHQLGRLVGVPKGEELRALNRENLKGRWPPTTLMLEARARRGKKSLFVTTALLLLETLIARIVMGFGLPVGGFDPAKYVEEITRNTGFARFDHTFATVFDCPVDRIPLIRAHLSARADLTFGLHVSDEALMTCLVTSPTQGLHVHFLDGGDGGYTSASKELKRGLAAARA